jgi:hypothetical protein
MRAAAKFDSDADKTLAHEPSFIYFSVEYPFRATIFDLPVHR